jgi:hypothetical protein
MRILSQMGAFRIEALVDWCAAETQIISELEGLSLLGLKRSNSNQSPSPLRVLRWTLEAGSSTGAFIFWDNLFTNLSCKQDRHIRTFNSDVS